MVRIATPHVEPRINKIRIHLRLPFFGQISESYEWPVIRYICTYMYNTIFPFLYSRVQKQVHGVMDIMKDNISKVLERGEKLSDLQDKSGLLNWLSQTQALWDKNNPCTVDIAVVMC